VKFLFDHDVPDELSYLLQQLGHDVSLLRQFLPRDASDPEVLQLEYENDFLLVTCNRDDFVELAKVNPHHGSSLLSVARHGLQRNPLCSVCWKVQLKLACGTTSTSRRAFMIEL